MDRNLLKEIVLEQNRDLAQLSLGLRREKLVDVQQVLHLPHIIAITGMRRCGKSTLMHQALADQFSDQVYYLDFEDERLLDFTVNDFNLLYEIFIELYGERAVFCFDEIQTVERWESYLRRMYKAGSKFIISGSSAELLSSELSTKLTGRHVTIELLPFSFHEYLAFSNIAVNLSQPILTKERGLLKNAFNQYLQFGGVPEYLKYQDLNILKNLYENILYKDVIVRYEIKAVKALRELALLLLSNPGSLISYSKLKNLLRLGSINTVKNYIHYLENAYLIFTVDRYAFSVGAQTVSSKKVYAVDTGFIESMGFQFSKNAGKYLENAVYLALRRQNEIQIYYYKTKNELEVDFCVRQGRTVVSLIQVAEHLDDSKTREREIRALTTAMEELNIEKGIIITLDHHETIVFEKREIRVIPVVEWLLSSRGIWQNHDIDLDALRQESNRKF